MKINLHDKNIKTSNVVAHTMGNTLYIYKMKKDIPIDTTLSFSDLEDNIDELLIEFVFNDIKSVRSLQSILNEIIIT